MPGWLSVTLNETAPDALVVLVRALVPAIVIAASGIDAGLVVTVMMTGVLAGPCTVMVKGWPTVGVVVDAVPVFE